MSNLKVISLIGFLGFLVSLFIMYRTDYGIRGIQAHSPSFRLLDMRFYYNPDTVKQTFEQIGEGGRYAYQRYLVLDFIFILCFFVTMITVSNFGRINVQIRTMLCILCGMRALFDVIENLLLIHMLRQYPSFNEFLASACSWFTTFKFIMLYFWLLIILLQILLSISSLFKNQL